MNKFTKPIKKLSISTSNATLKLPSLRLHYYPSLLFYQIVFLDLTIANLQGIIIHSDTSTFLIYG